MSPYTVNIQETRLDETRRGLDRGEGEELEREKKARKVATAKTNHTKKAHITHGTIHFLFTVRDVGGGYSYRNLNYRRTLERSVTERNCEDSEFSSPMF